MSPQPNRPMRNLPEAPRKGSAWSKSDTASTTPAGGQRAPLQVHPPTGQVGQTHESALVHSILGRQERPVESGSDDVPRSRKAPVEGVRFPRIDHDLEQVGHADAACREKVEEGTSLALEHVGARTA